MAMRLLTVSDDGSFVQKRFAKDSIPPYAILSHRWSTHEDDEITFKEIAEGIHDKRKPGYQKLQFCSAQAKVDGLHYIWVDTCCINQSDQNELSVAIYSMFRWYQKAVKCYVFLADVSTTKRKVRDSFSEHAWEPAFRSSKWFARGWTLQELLAPEIVEFYSRDGVRLGNKSSLEQQIAEITDIPIEALRGKSLSRFAPEKIFDWVKRRHTKKAEDKAYCLLGVFDVSMLLDYGEGEKMAFSRLYREIENRIPDMDSLLRNLPYAADAPFNTAKWQHESTCLPDTRVDLQQQIQDWIEGGDKRTLFWLHGLAGTGKSTIARTIAYNCFQQGRLSASFFFSKGGGDISHAGKFFTTIAIQLSEESQYLKRCIYNALKENKSIATQSYANQWRQLILGPLSKLDRGYRPFSFVFVIDAMDECESNADIRLILQLLVEAQSLKKVRLRVFLTSRPEIPIRHSMYDIPQAKHQDFVLQDIAPATINHDISLFLEHNLRIIGRKWTLGADWPGEEVLRQLVQYACGLFIWAATVCRFIREGKRFARERLDIILKGSSSGSTTPEKHLDEIYLTVLNHSISSEYSDKEKEVVYSMLKYTLGSLVVLLSPLSISSLSKLLYLPRGEINATFNDLYAILDIPDDPTCPLRLHHPSFRDFLLNKDRCREFWIGEKEAHQVLTTRCIQLMSQTLKKDICEMYAPGSQVSQIESSRVEKYLPPEVQYACLYWVQHLHQSGSQAYDEEAYRFLQAHLLHWLEALGWMGKSSEGVQAILVLEAHISFQSPDLYALIYDTKRFALYNRTIIEQSPLQLYCSALIFAPEKSIVREIFKKYIPSWIEKKSEAPVYWNASLQTLEGHSGWVHSVAFSPDGKQVVSGSGDRTVRLWDAVTGASLQTLKGHSDWVHSVAFSPDGKQVVSGSDDRTVQLWDAVTGASLQTLEGHSDWVHSVAFSPDGKQVVSGSDDGTVRLWDAVTGASLQTLEGHSGWVHSVAFSPDGKQVVSGSSDGTVRLWDAVTGASLQTLEGHSGSVRSVAFSPDGKLLLGLQVVTHWVVEGNTNILWLPPDYRGIHLTWNEGLVIGHPSG